MPVTSAGLLLYRRTPEPEVFVAHMGGPYWIGKREGAWTIPKGEFTEEEPFAAAVREFTEEVGVDPPTVPYTDLGAFRYSSGKRVHVFAGEAPDFEVDAPASNTFEMEWPPRSGRRHAFAEIDAVAWLGLAEARPLLVAGQRPALDALARRIADGG